MSTPSAPLERACGQTLFIGVDGTTLAPDVRRLLQEVRPGGVILFKRNVAGLADLAALCADLRSSVDPPPLLAIDEEGGRVTRLAPHVAGLPPAFATASLPAARLREYWRAYGALLAAIGIDVDFAPVVDLCPPDAPNGIADRSFGTDPGRVAACAAAAMDGLMDAGVVPTLKHFPGLGNTLLDSHHHLPSIRKTREAFEREDLAPFAALAPRAPAVMIGHGHYPFYAGPDPIAATLVPAISRDLLRGAAGFRGVAISDDLEMKAVAARVPWDELAPRTIAAGNDMVLICHRSDRISSAREAILARARSDPSFGARCEEAASKVDSLRRAAAEARSRALGGASGGAAGEGVDSARASLERCAASIPEAIA